MGLQFAPMLEVAADDVIFDYVKGETDGLAPARAEDAESELAQKDESVLGEGRASVIDWAHKDHYDASDVNRYRELSRVVQAMSNGELPRRSRRPSRTGRPSTLVTRLVVVASSITGSSGLL